MKPHIYGCFMCYCLKIKQDLNSYRKDVVKGRKWLRVTKKIITQDWTLKDIKRFEKAEKYYIEGGETTEGDLQDSCKERL